MNNTENVDKISIFSAGLSSAVFVSATIDCCMYSLHYTTHTLCTVHDSFVRSNFMIVVKEPSKKKEVLRLYFWSSILFFWVSLGESFTKRFRQPFFFTFLFTDDKQSHWTSWWTCGTKTYYVLVSNQKEQKKMHYGSKLNHCEWRNYKRNGYTIHVTAVCWKERQQSWYGFKPEIMAELFHLHSSLFCMGAQTHSGSFFY